MIDSPDAIFYLYKVKSSNHNRLLLSFSERAGIRTPDNLIKSQVLYHLSYTLLNTRRMFIDHVSYVKVKNLSGKFYDLRK